MKIEKTHETSVSIEIPSENNQKQTIMLSSDWHYDSTCCDLDLLTKHLRIAEKYQAIVLVAGDLLDVMQGKNDPRRSIEELKDEYRTNSYFDAVVADTANFLSKFDVPGYILCDGNHELGVLDHNGTDLLNNVCYQLRYEYQKKAIHMGYWGYMPITFNYTRGGAKSSKLLYWFHGTSSHAVVTKGIIQVNRQGVWLNAPDFVVNGHTHDAYTRPEPIEEFNMKTRQPYRSGKVYFRSPGYKNSTTDTMKTQDWASRTNRAPKNKGCYFLHLEYTHSQGDIIEHSYTAMVQ